MCISWSVAKIVWIKFVFEKLAVARLFNKIHPSFGTRRFIYLFITVGRRSHNRGRWMERTTGCCVSLRCVLTLFYHSRLRFPNDCFLQGFPTKSMLPINLYVNMHTFFLLRRCGSTRAMASSFIRFLDHTQRRFTVGRTPLDAWSVRRRDLYLTTHNTHNTQTFIHQVGFEPIISAGERP